MTLFVQARDDDTVDVGHCDWVGFGRFCDVGVVREKEKEVNRLCNVIVPYITENL